MAEVFANFHLLLLGVKVTLQAAAVVVVVGSVLGVFIGLGLLYGPAWLRPLLRVYVDVLRGLPLLVQIFIIYYVPEAFDITVNQFNALTISLSLFAGAHIGEIVRGAVLGVPKGQSDAAKALGLTFWPRTWGVILPQALPTIIPPWTNTAIEMVKGTSLGYLLSVNELTFATYKVIGRVGEAMPFYLTVAVIYFVINFAISRLAALVERRVRFAT
ncbi:MAG: amino acid ABC transporter permease [Thermomicrobiales bacterium]